MRATATTTQLEVEHFLPASFKLTNWATLKVFYDNLLERHIDSVETLEQWIRDRNDLDSAISESFSWRYIHITVINTPFRSFPPA